jgi:hypothetical protein
MTIRRKVIPLWGSVTPEFNHLSHRKGSNLERGEKFG